MALNRKTFKSEITTGFGEKSALSGGRFYRKDGKANVIRRGINFFDQLSWYHTLLNIPRWEFWFTLLGVYILVNCLFAFIYVFAGVEHLAGIQKGMWWQNYIEAFFFSEQTFTTVGYAQVSPSGLLTSIIASFESFLGVLSLALASGLFYGRFSKPRSFLKFSDIALLTPFREGTAFMFRTVPYKNNQLLEAEVKLLLGMRVNKDGEEKNVFYNLKVEYSKINSLALNWTIVHPIDEESPMYGMTLEELKNSSAEVLVHLQAYDEGFSSTVIARTSYTAHEMVEGAKFKPMYHSSEDGTATVLEIDLLNQFEMVPAPKLKQAGSV